MLHAYSALPVEVALHAGVCLKHAMFSASLQSPCEYGGNQIRLYVATWPVVSRAVLILHNKWQMDKLVRKAALLCWTILALCARAYVWGKAGVWASWFTY